MLKDCPNSERTCQGIGNTFIPSHMMRKQALFKLHLIISYFTEKQNTLVYVVAGGHGKGQTTHGSRFSLPSRLGN